MQIFVKIWYPDKTVTLNVQSLDTILTVRGKIKDRFGISVDQHRFNFGGKDICQQNILCRDIPLIQCSTLYLIFRLKGGGFPTIKFNSMSEPIIGKFSEDAPQWRIINYGLNLQGVCKNQNCEANKNKVWISKGYGKFNMSMEVYKAKCTKCMNFCENVQNIGLFQAKCISKGRVKGQQNERRMESVQVKQDEFLTFQDKDETRVDWLYLEMEVIEL